MAYLISLIFAPPFPMMHPIRSFGMLISVVAVAEVANAAAVAAPCWPKLLVAAKVAKAKVKKYNKLLIDNLIIRLK